MKALAALLVAAAADDCCWVQRSVKGTTFKKPRQTIEACDTKHRCFVACSVSRLFSAPKKCTCDPTIVAREANFSLAKTLVSQHMRSVYAGAWLAPYDLAKRVPWNALMGAPLEASSYGVFKEDSAVWRSALPESLYVMHLSAYEHSVVARNPWEEAMRRVDAVINWQLRDLCGTTPRRWPLYEKTGAVVAFFGGVSRIRYVDVEGAASTKVDTGNAHSLQPRSIKVKALKASVCSLLRDVASVVRVAVCDQDDHQAASEALGELADVVVVPCGNKPRNLPFLALHDAVSQFAGKAYVAFSESDLTWRFASNEAAEAASKLFRAAPSSVLTPHRWHKRYGSTAEKGDAFGSQPTGQNLCSLRAGARMAAVARMPG